jgi:hypothetical protein
MSDQAEAFADNRIRVAETHHRTHHLVELLVSYVSEADADLPRDQFLRLVINRIVDELCSPLPRPRWRPRRRQAAASAHIHLSDELAVMMCGIDQSVRPSTLARKHEKPKRGAKQAMPKTRRPLVIDKGRNRQIQAKPNGQKL